MTIRRFALPDDLELLVDIALESFQYPENPDWSVQQDEEESIGSQLHAVRRLWPLLRALSAFYPGLRDQLSGFVCEEDGEPAGLVMYQPTSILGGKTWIISTVAVRPDFRRKGLGRRLVEAALDAMKERSASTIRLQVLAGNKPAYELYRSLGFDQYSVGIALDRAADAAPVTVAPIPAGLSLEPQGRWDWEPRFELATRLTPENVQVYKPIVQGDFCPPPPIRVLAGLIDRLSGTASSPVAVFDEASEAASKEKPLERAAAVAAVGRLDARTKSGGVNVIFATVDPTFEQLADHLISFLTNDSETISPGRRTTISVAEWQRPLLDAAVSAGFVATKEWHDLGLVLT
jgi:ribosomal protein S18 acetylase RimI-like enzyme